MPKISDFRPQQRNANRHTQRGLGMLDKSMADNGFIGAMTSAADGEIFDGSARLETAYDRFGEEVEPIVVDADGTRPIIVRRVDIPSASDPKAKKLAIAANRIAQVDLDWDPEVLAAVNQEIDIGDLFFENELEDIFKTIEEDLDKEIGKTDPDDIPDEEQVETRVKRGEVWQLGRHRIMCGDSTCKADVEKLMDGTIAEMCFTSPPYSAMRQYEEGTDISISYLSKIFGAWLNNCNYFVINLGLQFKDGEVVEYWDEWIKAAKDEGLKLLAWNVWDKQQMGSIASATNMFGLTHEWLFVFGESRKRLNRTVPNQLEKYASRHGDDFLEGIPRKAKEFDGSISIATSKAYTHHQIHSVIQQTSERSNIRDLHPAKMPVGLPEQYIEAMTDNTQSVVDCFLGSGSTLIACEKTDRTCYGMEISEKYCDVIIQRWEDFTGKTAELLIHNS